MAAVPPLQLADLLGHKVTGGVLQAGVEVAVGFQVEQLAHILAGGIFEGGGLDDGGSGWARHCRAYNRPAHRWYHGSLQHTPLLGLSE